MKYPIGIQTFEKIRQNGYVYVDKTDLIYKLAQGSVYFLARPRRFGKSLLLDTLRCYFEGRRDLFEGLKIMELELEWNDYPVISFDFNGLIKVEDDPLRNYLFSQVKEAERRYDITPEDIDDLGLRFRRLLSAIHEKTNKQVVVLVDEYDKPLLDFLGTDDPDDAQRLDHNREILRGFFSIFKAADRHLRFVMLTGVTKFSQVTMFSGTNQPDDISLSDRYDTLLGITEKELYTVFAEPIRELADTMGKSEEEMKALLKRRYDGYHFSERLIDVYNPFSLLNVFADMKMRDYWFASGTPTYAVRLLGQTQEDVMTFTQDGYTLDEFINYKADVAKPLPMIFQAGYLTIKDFDPDMETYRLDFPNMEVRRGLITLLANDYLQLNDKAMPAVIKMVKALRVADLDLLRRLLTAFFAETPYAMRPKKDQKDRELYFHYTFYLILRLISCYIVYTEKQLSEGRADCIIETGGYVYIFEFKLDGTAAEALQQINDRGYARPYEADARPIYKIGASFSSKTGTIEDWDMTLIRPERATST